MEGTNVCFAPVPFFDEAINHPHNVARQTFLDIEGVVQMGPHTQIQPDKMLNPMPPARDGCGYGEHPGKLGF